MTLPVVWNDEAEADLLEIIAYISARNQPAAARLHAAILHSVERLSEHPHIHRPGRVPDTREAVIHPNYILIYRTGAAAIEILALVHARQQYP